MEGSWIISIVSILFAIGAYGAIVHKNVIRVLISLEVIFNSEILLLVYISSLINPLNGFALVLFTLILSASEVGIVVSIIVLYYKLYKSVEIKKVGGEA